MNVLLWLSGFFTGVGVTCAAFIIYLHHLRKELREVIEGVEELVEELKKE